MKATTATIRIFLGAWMLYFGMNYFVLFSPQPMGVHSRYLHEAFMESGLFAVAKMSEIVLGIALLSNRLVPLALVATFPVSVIVAWLGLVIEEPRFWPATILISHILLLVAYLPHYFPMLVWKARPLRRLSELPQGFLAVQRHSASSEPLVPTADS